MNNVIEVNGKYPAEIIEGIIEKLKEKKIIIMPSDTIYGFLALPACEERIRKIKKRDAKPFIFLISEIKTLGLMGIDPSKYKDILSKYWPGPATFIMKRTNKENNKIRFSGNYETIGVRLPDWRVLSEIINKMDSPLISTSVNYSGENPISNAAEIIKKFSAKVDLIISDINFKSSISSTIADITEKPFKILREGSVKIDEIY